MLLLLVPSLLMPHVRTHESRLGSLPRCAALNSRACCPLPSHPQPLVIAFEPSNLVGEGRAPDDTNKEANLMGEGARSQR